VTAGDPVTKQEVAMAGEIVPFGKYKGQPVEIMAQDRQYVDWLTAQPWFREKFQPVYNILVQNFQEPAETPDHNALQARFLDQSFRDKVFRMLNPGLIGACSAKFEVEGFDVHLSASWHRGGDEFYLELKPTVADDYPAVLRQIKSARDRFRPVADEWVRPSQQILENPHRKAVLFLEEYQGAGATVEQFIEIFESSGIKVIFLDEVA
jgi:hypothetical protein